MNPAVIAACKAQAATFAECAVFWPNEKITPPTDANGLALPFIWSELTGLASTILSMGAPGQHRIRDDGFLRVHVMIAAGAGIEPAAKIAEDFAALFRLTQPNGQPGLQTLAPTPAEGGASSDDGNYYGLSFSIPFWFFYTG